MKLVIGLGNPGEEYKKTRHNVGYLFVDKLLSTKLPKDLIVKKTGVFMNSSGDAVRKFTSIYSLVPSDLYVVHDDLDIKLGKYKIQFGVGPKEHKGLNSIYEALGTKDFWHLRIGVDNRIADKEKRIKGEEYVLQDFDDEELLVITNVIKKAVKDLVLRIKK